MQQQWLHELFQGRKRPGSDLHQSLLSNIHHCFTIILPILLKTNYHSQDLLTIKSMIINDSIISGYFPTAFKRARFFPQSKKTPVLDPSDISNYRPVSPLSFLSKILECIVYTQVSLYLLQNNLQDPNLSGIQTANYTDYPLGCHWEAKWSANDQN